MRMGKTKLVCLQLAGCWHCAVVLSLPGEARSGLCCEKVEVSRRKPDTEQLLVVHCQNSKLNKVRFCQAWKQNKKKNQTHSNAKCFIIPDAGDDRRGNTCVSAASQGGAAGAWD